MASKLLVLCVAIWLLCSLSISAQLQHRVGTQNLHYRCYAIVPFIGSGTPDDPRRPKYTPAPADAIKRPAVAGNSAARAGILGWTMIESDDKKWALVEFVAADHASIQEILKDSAIKAFDSATASVSDVEAAFQQHRKDFSMRYFAVRVK